MTRTVAVAEAAASFRRGLDAALDRAGYAQAGLDESPGAVLATLRFPDDCESFDRLCRSGALVVALLPDPSPAGHAHAFEHGAAGAVDWKADPETIVATLQAAWEGTTALPVEVARALAAEWPSLHAHRPEVDPEEVAWLIELAAGRTVARLADDSGFSERAMFRRLHDLYTRLGVSGRSEAIVAAERLGLLSDSDQTGSNRA